MTRTQLELFPRTHSCNIVSVRLDNDSPTLRITGCPKKLERISVPVSVTRLCAIGTPRIRGVAPTRLRGARASAPPRPSGRASCGGGRATQLQRQYAKV